MKDYYSIIIVVLLIIIFCLGAIILVIEMLWKKNKKYWAEEANTYYKKGREEVEDVMRMTLDKIQVDKVELTKKSEKEIMIESMMALGSYSRRLDRIEKRIGCIDEYKEYINNMNNQTKLMVQNTIDLKDNIEETGSQVVNFKQAIDEIMNNVNKVNASLTEVSNIGQNVDLLISRLGKTVLNLENINTQMNTISNKVNSFFENYSESPIEIINSIKSIVIQVQESITTVKSIVDIGWRSIDCMNNTLDNVEGKINSALDEYSSYSVLGMISDLKSSVDDMKSDIDDMKSDIDDMKSNVDDLKYTIGITSTDSIYSKLDDIESQLSGK